MAVPSSGQITLVGIFSEKNEDDYTSNNPEENNISLRGLSSNSHNDSAGGNINLNSNSGSNPPNQTAPFAMSEFYGYDHDFAPAVAAFTFTNGTADKTMASSFMVVDGEGASSSGNLGAVISQINFTWGTAGLAWQFVDDHFTCNVSETGADSTSSGMDQAFAITNFNSTSVTKVEVRWRVVSGVAGSLWSSGNKITANYHRTGSQTLLRSTNRDTGESIRTTTGTGWNYTGSYVDVTPAQVGGSYSNSQSHSIACEIGGHTSTYEGQDVLFRVGTSGAIYLDVRVTGANGSGGSKTEEKSFKKAYSSTTNPRMEFTEFEPPDFTCIMPDMIVNEQTKGYIRIGDVVVGDRILARGSLSDSSAPEQYVEVTEARTHTRSGYWNVDGIHITNDHPVWLTDESSSAWVKVEDMRDGITRNYVAGTVDPVYLGTNPGWYYVWSADRTKGFTVSGDYAPTTE